MTTGTGTVDPGTSGTGTGSVNPGTTTGTGTVDPGTPVEIDPGTNDDPPATVIITGQPTNDTTPSTKSTTYSSAGQTAGTLTGDNEDPEDEEDLSGLPIGLTVIGFGTGASHIGPQEDYKPNDPEPVKGGDSYHKMNVFTK